MWYGVRKALCETQARETDYAMRNRRDDLAALRFGIGGINVEQHIVRYGLRFSRCVREGAVPF